MIRVFQYGDERAIADIFCRAIHEIAIEVYTEEQCLAWSSKEPNYERWAKRCELKRPFVCEKDGNLAGFLELDPDGHIDCAYINPDYQKQGIMSALVRHAVKVCSRMDLEKVYVEASISAKPLFEKLGFTVVQEKEVILRGVALRNYDMELIFEERGPHAGDERIH
ncbi:MAG: GNAT family N-acetyltransferase [Puniceicoccaceae bacterium]